MIDSGVKYKIIFEASKLYEPAQDGVKRYIEELLKEIYLLLKDDDTIQFNLLLGKHIVPIQDCFKIDKKGRIVKNELLYSNEFLFFKEGVIMNILMMIFVFPVLPFRKKIMDIYQSRYYPVMLTMLTRLGKGKYPKLEKELSTYDLVHVALPQNMLFFEKVNTSFLVTIHDVSHKLFPQYHTKDNIKRSELGIKLSKDKNADFLAVSSSTKSDFKNHYGLEKIKMIHEGVNPKYFYPKLEQESFELEDSIYDLGNKKFYLALGTLEPRKNLLGTINAFLELENKVEEDLYLIVAGGKGWKNRKIKKQLNIKSDKIIFLGFVPNQYLRYLYIHALVLVYPSFYEGFGLPLLESMACGTPVIYGDNSAMKEVVANAGIAVAPNMKEDLKEAMEAFLDESFRNDKSMKSLGIASKKKWEYTAVETLNLYKNIITESSRKK